jgi:Type II secretion system (T2SS), protein E, N-terminal domain
VTPVDKSQDATVGGLVTRGPSSLAVRSGALVRRGLQDLSMRATRTLRFPRTHSVGRLTVRSGAGGLGAGPPAPAAIGSVGRVNAIGDFDVFLWTTSPMPGESINTVDAMGDIEVPIAAHLHLELGQAGADDLTFLEEPSMLGLQSLSIGYLDTADAQFAQLAQLVNLRSLRLCGPDITDAVLGHVQRIAALESLVIESTRITDAGVAQLAGLSALNQLMILGSPITDLAVAHLARLKALKVLVVTGSRITQAGRAQLQSLERLDWIWITSEALLREDPYARPWLGKTIDAILAEMGLVTSEKLGQAFAETRVPRHEPSLVLSRLLQPRTYRYVEREKVAGLMRMVDHGWLTEVDLLRALARQRGLEYVDLAALEVDRSAASLLESNYERSNEVLPVALVGKDTLRLAMSDINDICTMQFVRTITGYDVEPALATGEDILRQIDKMLWPEV